MAVLLGLVYSPLGQAAAYLAWPFTAYTIRAVELLAGLPGGALALGRVEPVCIAIYYVILISLALAGPRLRDWYQARRPGQVEAPVAVPILATAVLGVLAVFVWRSALAAPDGRLHLTVLDVGTGDAVLVQTPGGRNLLIDGGESPSLLSDALGRRLPIGRRQLDWLVIAATGEGQVGALPRIIERFPPGAATSAMAGCGSISAAISRPSGATCSPCARSVTRGAARRSSTCCHSSAATCCCGATTLAASGIRQWWPPRVSTASRCSGASGSSGSPRPAKWLRAWATWRSTSSERR